VEQVDYQFTCLPFGLACALWAFTKIMKAVVTLLRSWGIKVVIYIDNILIIPGSALLAVQHLEVHPSAFGVHNQHREVGDVPNSGIRIPGHDDKHKYLLVSHPEDTVKQIRAESIRNSNMTALSARLPSLTSLGSSVQAILLAPLFYHCL